MTPKFRVWDRLTGKMFPVGIIDCSIQAVYIEEPNGLDSCRNFDEIELMQSTGLEDKNGKEIFEGDVVKYEVGRNTYTEEVAYDKNFAGFGVKDAKANVVFTFGEIAENISLISLEVIGNIYENPGLLEEE
nr:MAG: YopX protein [Bacteriophage sp.]